VHQNPPSTSRDPFATGEMGVLAILRTAFGGRFVGVLVRGDAVPIDGREVGTVVGFDECHFPNHLNIVLQIRPSSGHQLADIPADTD
jgi:hypothetical protein